MSSVPYRKEYVWNTTASEQNHNDKNDRIKMSPFGTLFGTLYFLELTTGWKQNGLFGEGWDWWYLSYSLLHFEKLEGNSPCISWLVSLDCKTIPHPPPLILRSLTVGSEADKKAP